MFIYDLRGEVEGEGVGEGILASGFVSGLRYGSVVAFAKGNGLKLSHSPDKSYHHLILH